MNDCDFENILEGRIVKIRSILKAKATEYARGDRLSNFKKAAALENCTPETALVGMMTKHIIALYDFVQDLEADHIASIAQWDEKIGDTINYLILLEGLVRDRINESSGRL